MSMDDFRGSAFYFRELMRQAQADINTGGEIKKARVIAKTANPAKTSIGWFKRRLLRGEFRRRA